MTSNGSLHAAKRARYDEFYTRYDDIDTEVQAYLDHDPNTFRGKTILLPADDPKESNFTKFFAENFGPLGIKRLISTSYNKGGRGKKFVLDRDVTGDGKVTLADLQVEDLDGDGDFRSPEVTALRDEADIIITNPPFSLLGEFLPWIGDKKFLLIGNFNWVTYKEVWPFVLSGRLWLGATAVNRGMYFYVPPGFVYSKKYKFRREIDGKPAARVASACWFTNLDHGLRHVALTLSSTDDNLRFSRSMQGKSAYDRYDNYDAIHIPEYVVIPSDHDGVMGVPVTYMFHHNPEQFEIVGCTYDYGRPAGWDSDVKMAATIEGRDIYKRIFIRHRKPATNSAA